MHIYIQCIVGVFFNQVGPTSESKKVWAICVTIIALLLLIVHICKEYGSESRWFRLPTQLTMNKTTRKNESALDF